MTVSSTNRRAGPFTGNGVTTAFPFAFRMLDVGDLLVVTRVIATGVEETLVQGVDYTATLNPDQDASPGGTATLVAALPASKVIVLTSDVPLLQETIFTNLGGFYPEVLNDALDRLTIFTQQLDDENNRALKVSVTSAVDGDIVPVANGLLRWNGDGTALITVPIADLQSENFYATSYADVFTGDGVTTVFALTADPVVISNMDVAVAGATKYPTTDYTLAGGSITFAVAPANAAKILVRYQQTAILTAGVQSVAGLMGVISGAALKAALSLDNVENKSSATIRGELTGANVVAALGFTPQDAATGFTKKKALLYAITF